MPKEFLFKVGKFKMYLDPLKRGISGQLFGQGYREPCFMWIIKREAKGNLGLDIGANLGYVTLHLAQNMKKVIAIEPDKRPLKLLKKNIKINNFSNKVEIMNCALSDKGGKEIIYLSKKRPNLNTFCDSGFLKKSKDFKEKKNISVMTLDDMNLSPNFIKMDIEGYEVNVIEGGINTLKKQKECKLLIEVHPQYYNGERDFSKILEKLYSIGFTSKYVVSAGGECPDLFKKRGYSPIKTFVDGEHKRGIFCNISKKDVIDFCAYPNVQEYEYTDSDSGKTIKKVSKKIARSLLMVKQ